MQKHNHRFVRMWHRIRENKTARLPSRFIAVDTETKTRQISAIMSEQSLKFGCAVYWDTARGNKKVDHREVINFTRATTFWDFVDRHTLPRTRTILTAHNMAFDLMVLDGVMQLRKRGWEVEYPICSGMRFISTARRNGATLLMVDTLNYCPTSLRELGDSIGLSKLEMPGPRASQRQWVEYCRRDVDIVEQFWKQMMDFLRTNDYGSFGVTAAALALKIYRHKFIQDEIVIHNVESVTALERAALHGGRNECYRVGTLPEAQYYLLDVNSLYPAIMARLALPRLLAFHHGEISIDELHHATQRYCLIARVSIETNEPVYPAEIKNRLVFPVGAFETTLAGPELEHALREHRVVRVHEVAAYERGSLFNNYVHTLYEQRQQYKSSDQPAFSLFCKVLLNSLYGKFAQHGYAREELPGRSNVEFGCERLYSEKLGGEVFVTYWAGHAYVEHQNGEAFDAFPAIAATITSAGRLRMWNLMQQAGRDNVFYCDTDALIVNDQGHINLRDRIDPTRLGALKLVHECRHVELHGKKDYVLDDIVRIKGIKRDAVRIDGGIWEQERFQTMREAIRAGRVKNVITIREEKKLARIYDAGLVGADGLVSPIAVNNF